MGVERAEVKLDFILRAGKDRGAAGWADVALLVVVGLAGDLDRVIGKDCGGVKQGAVMFGAVPAVADADAFWLALCGEAELAA